MKILKYKKATKGRYKIYLDDGSEILLYEEVILKYQLLLKKEIDQNTLIEIDKLNQEWDVYYIALSSIKNRFKSVYELKKLLERKEYPTELVDKAINKLLEQGYLNDRIFSRSYIRSQIVSTNKGPYKIAKELADKRIDPLIIKEEIISFNDEEQTLRIKKIIEKSIKNNHNSGGVVLKQKIYNHLKNLGYNISLINNVISEYSFVNNKEIQKKEYEKYYKKYSKKYSGYELENKIREKLYMKGLLYEE